MARAVSLSLLRTRALQRANLESAVGFIDPTAGGELDDLINEGIAELWNLVRSAYGQDYYLKSATFSTSATTDTYALGTIIPAGDFVALRGIDITFGNNIVLTAKPFMFSQRNRYKWLPGWVYSQPIFYRLEGDNLVLMPTPAGVFNVKIWYVPAPTKLVNSGDTFDGIAGFEEYAVLHAAIKMLRKDGNAEDAMPLQQDLATEKAKIEALAHARDAENPERVVDVELVNVDAEAGIW